MVRLPLGYCIDSTEVTREAYAAWLASAPHVEQQVAVCTWNASFAPYRDWPAPELDPKLPVTWVDWCDAFAYCRSAGKRLCGERPAAQTELSAACSSNGENAYPYGNEFDASSCNGFEATRGAPVAAGTMKRCQAATQGYAGVHDLSGNVSEWENACLHETPVGKDTFCSVRGGSFELVGQYLRCRNRQVVTRESAARDVGFRCCADG